MIEFFNNFHVQILIIELVFCRMYSRKKFFWFRFLPCAIIYCTLPYVVPGGYFNERLTLGSWFAISFLLMMILTFVLLNFCFVMSFKEILFYCCAAHTIQHLIHAMSEGLVLFMGLSGIISGLAQLLIAVLTIPVSYHFLKKHLIGSESVDIRNSSLLAFAVFSSVLIYCFSLWTTMVEGGTVGFYILDAFCCFLMLIILFDAFEFRKIQKQYLIMQHLLYQEQQQHAISAANVEVINRKCHDLKHQISALRRMDKGDEKERSIRELEEAVLLYERFPKTGSSALDLILAERGMLCEQNGIKLRCIADGGKLGFMGTEDLYSFFGNALDNAIEAVSQMPDREERIIGLNIFSWGNFLSVHVENRCMVDPEFKDGLPVTTKEDKEYHGYGVRSMKYLAEKYGGTLAVQCEDGVFELNALFPCT